MRVLILDDDRCRVITLFKRLALPNIQFDWAFTVDQAIAFLDTRVYNLVFLDHDLCESTDAIGVVLIAKLQEKQGMEAIDWLVEKAKTLYWMNLYRTGCKFIIHSWNDDKAPIMAQRLQDAGYEHVEQSEFKE